MLFAFAPGAAAPRAARWARIALAMALVGLRLPRWIWSASRGLFPRVDRARSTSTARSTSDPGSTPSWCSTRTASPHRFGRSWGKTFSLKNNGKVDASNDSDMATQIIVGLLPLLLYHKPAPPRVALVGYGSGVTRALSPSSHPVARVVELEPANLPRVALLRERQPPPARQPKVTARVGDGRNFLGQRTDPFDVIVSQRRTRG